jgi:hypothetical protein
LLAAVSDFNHGVDQISFADQTQRHLEELPLKSRFDVRNDDYKAGVQRCPTIKGQEIRPVVRNKCVIPLHTELHKLLVFRTDVRSRITAGSKMAGFADCGFPLGHSRLAAPFPLLCFPKGHFRLATNLWPRIYGHESWPRILARGTEKGRQFPGGLLVNAGNHLRSHTRTRAVPSPARRGRRKSQASG